MKKYRKQSVNVHGKKQLVDVPVDGELYKADNREEYQRVRSNFKHIPLDTVILADFTADVAEAYEEKQLLEHLREALKALTEKERLLIEYHYYDGLTEKETAKKLKISQQNMNRKKHRIIQKLRNSLIDWL